MYQVTFYVPEEHCEAVKEAMFAAGAGRFNQYEKCCWQTLGEGQYQPLEGSDPYQGETNKLERCVEYKVEMICEEDCLQAVIAAMKEAHPYEEVAHFVVRCHLD